MRDVPLTSGERHLRVVLALVFALIGAALVASVLITILLVYPFTPLKVFSTTVTPLKACPGQEVGVGNDSEIEKGWDLDRIEIESAWEVAGSGGADEFGGTGTIYEPPATERSTERSAVLRNAPDDPGEYRLHTTATVYGTFSPRSIFHGFPKTQRLEYYSEDLLMVMPANSKMCERGGG